MWVHVLHIPDSITIATCRKPTNTKRLWAIAYGLCMQLSLQSLHRFFRGADTTIRLQKIVCIAVVVAGLSTAMALAACNIWS